MAIRSSTVAQCLFCIAANMGTFFMTGTTIGWAMTVISELTDPTSPSPLTADEVGWVMSIIGLGGMLGAVVTWLLVDRIGRKTTILVSPVPMALGYVIMAVKLEYPYLMVGRILAGIGMGISASAGPTYVGEITEPRVRGAMGIVSATSSNGGILFCVILGPHVSAQHLNVICATMTCVFGVIMFAIPESPYFHLMKGKTNEATRSLIRLRRTTDVTAELEKLTRYVESKKAEVSSIFDLFTTRANRRAFAITMILIVTQQYSGAVAVPVYIYEILDESGLDAPIDALALSVIVVMLVASVLGIFLVDRIGRRALLFFGGGAMSVCLIACGIFFLLKSSRQYDVSGFAVIPLIGVLGHAASVSVSMNCLPFVIMSEYFSTTVKVKASMCYGIASALLGGSSIKLFQLGQDNLGLGPTFLICVAPLLLGTFVLYFRMPETKGIALKSVEELHNDSSVMDDDFT